MSMNFIKGVLNKLINFKQNTPSVSNNYTDDLADFHNKLIIINGSADIDDNMKRYANKLIHIYLPAVLSSYEACKDNSEEMSSRLNRTADDIKSEIMASIDSCLSDIEFGASFADNLPDTFLISMVDFEQKLESRQSL